MSTMNGSQVQNRNQIAFQSEPKLLAPREAIKIDRAIVLNNIVLISGWMSGTVKLLVTDAKKFVIYERGDVSPALFDKVRGFLIMATVAPDEWIKKVTVQHNEVAYNSALPLTTELSEIQLVLSEHIPRLAYILSEVKHEQEWCKLLYPFIPHYASDQVEANIEQSCAIMGIGLSVLGWCVSRSSINLWFFSEFGQMRKLSDSVKFYRQDVTNEFSGKFGSRCEMSGFFCSIAGPVTPGMKLSVVAEISGVLFKVQEKVVDKGASTALGYARWAFNIHLPHSGFTQRLASHDGKFIEEIRRREIALEEAVPEVWSVGVRPATPMASVIVPLYKRSDFVEHQLLSFENDKDFYERFAELIYVIDDPALYDRLKHDSNVLYKLYGVPMTFVFGGRNRGFSGANNLGASIARGTYLFFLNSDVFPEETGWISRMVDILVSQPHYGILGARLLYPQGAVQHIGMEFVYSDSLNLWLNEHPGINLPINRDLPAVISVPAVTGACMALSREDFAQAGGFDESYLIGDFEDSDLCLKIRQMRKDIGCLTDTRLIHLERQSVMHAGGDASFRQCVTLYNGWKHTTRWDEQIRLTTNG